NPRFGLASTPKVVGGTDPVSSSIAAALYRTIVPEVVLVSSAAVAEAGKLTENIFRAVNIALVNELKIIFDGLDIDVWEVLDAAETKPFGFMRFDPGPGWGGHCIPIDPFYLAWKAQQAGVDARFVELAGEINTLMPRWVVRKLEIALEERGKGLAGSRILLLGVAYKKDVGDPRESPAFELLSILRQKGAKASYHDPHIPETPSMRTWSDLPPLRSQPLKRELLAAQDAVVIVTDHSAVDYEMVLEESALVVDTRGIYRQLSDRIVKA
ncbi:MAG: nucleotide sugar dehydrogenase, partial [Acidobacteriota bacterium]|nr:nucleotide sugar dehydrogenase [Acidobacteriota bacterium]